MITLQAAEAEQARAQAAEARKVVQAALEQLPKWVTDNPTTTITSRKGHWEKEKKVVRITNYCCTY